MADVGLTKAQIIGVCAELSTATLTDDDWALIIELTQAELNPSLNGFGSTTRANIAGRYLGAHKALKLLKTKVTGGSSTGGAGPLSSVTVGGVSKTFRTPGTVDQVAVHESDLLTTAPGREYLRLMRLWSGRVAVA